MEEETTIKNREANGQLPRKQDKSEDTMDPEPNNVVSGHSDPCSPMLPPTTWKNGKASTRPQYVAALAATLMAFVIGTVIGWSSPAIPLLQASGSSLPVTDQEGSWIGSILGLGAFVGAIPVGILVERFGRKNTILYLSVPFVIGWVMLVSASDVWTLYIGRFVGGLGVGATMVVAPIYIAEIAEDHIRGTLASYFTLMLTIGIVFSYGVGSITSFVWLGIILCALPIIAVGCFLWMPETPQHLLANGRRKEAERSLIWLRGEEYDVLSELNRIQKTMEDAAANKESLKDLLTVRVNRKALFITVGLMVFQQLGGINAVLFFTASIFNDAGSSLSDNVATIIVGTVQVAATYVTTLLVDRVGRKLLLFVSAIGMAVCLGTLGLYFYLSESGQDVGNISWLPLLSLTLYIITYNLGFGALPWVVMAEIFSPNAKGPASAVSGSLCWLLGFIVSKVFQNMKDLFGSGWTFWIFAICCVFGSVFTYRFVPETKGKSMEQIQRELSGTNVEIQSGS